MRKEQWINIRGLAILSVIIIHTTTMRFNSSSMLNNWINLFFDQVSRFAVPVFFMSSGFGLGLKHMTETNILNFYKKRLKIIPEYIFWSIVYFVFSSNDKSLSKLLIDIITGNASGQLYFVIVLIQFYLLFPFIRRIAVRKIGLLIFFVITVSCQIMYQSGYNFETYTIWNWLFYFNFGIYLANNHNLLMTIKRKSTFIFLIGTIAILFSAGLFFEFSERPINLITSTIRPTMIFYSIGIMSVFLMRLSKPLSFFRTLDKHSLTIYYVHLLFLKVLFLVLEKVKVITTNFFVLVIVALLTVGLSLAFSVIYDGYRDKFIEYIKGLK